MLRHGYKVPVANEMPTDPLAKAMTFIIKKIRFTDIPMRAK